MNKEKQIGGGLLELPSDSRDFSLGGMFGQPKLTELPEDFIVTEVHHIDDQGDSDYCTSYAGTAASMDQEGVDFEPGYNFMKTKLIMKNKEWGADLRSMLKSFVKFGSLPRDKSPYKTMEVDRDFLLNSMNWDKLLDEIAIRYRKASFFKIDGRYDRFDNIRAALWQNKEDKATAMVGVMWQNEWTGSPGGVVSETPGTPAFGHAFKIYGWKKIEGIVYLIAQLSNGTDIGDNGLFYFSRKLINEQFNYGTYMFKDIEPGEVKKAQWSWWIKVVNMILGLFK